LILPDGTRNQVKPMLAQIISPVMALQWCRRDVRLICHVAFEMPLRSRFDRIRIGAVPVTDAPTRGDEGFRISLVAVYQPADLL
jgi:hypothetical protein